MFATLWSVLFVFVLFTIAAGIGARLGDALRLLPCLARRSERWLLATALGAGALSLGIFLLGLCSLLYWFVVFPLIVVVGCWCWRESWAALQATVRMVLVPIQWILECLRTPARRLWGLWMLAVLLTAAVYSFCVVCGALAPPADSAYDVLTYHFTVPALYLRWHAVRYDPYILHSNFPQITEMLYLCGLMASVPGIQLVHFVFGLMTAGVCWALARRYGRTAAFVAASVFWFTPVVGWEASIGYDDLSFAFFQSLAFLCILGASRSTAERLSLSRDEDARRWLLMAGVMQGLSLGVKYSSLAFVPLLVAAAMGVYLQRSGNTAGSWKNAANAALIVCAATAVIGIPWYLRTFAWTGNPVFPYFYSLFGGRNWSVEAASYYRNLQIAYGTGHNVPDLLSAAWSLVTVPNRYYEPAGNAAFGQRFGSVGPAYLLLIVLVGLVGGWRRCAALLAIVFCLFFFEWYLLMQQVRYLIEALPLLAPACGLALVSRRVDASPAYDPLPRLYRSVVGLILLLFFAWTTFNMSLLYIVPLQTGPDSDGSSALFADLGIESRETYLGDRMRDLWPVSDWVDLNVPADARVALLGEPRGYYMNREVLWADGYEQEKIRYSEIGGPQGLVDALEEAGVSYVVARLGSPLGLVAGYGRLQPRTPANWEDIDYSRKDSRWLALYEVAVKRGLLQQVYPDPGAASSDLGGYAVYHVGRT